MAEQAELELEQTPASGALDSRRVCDWLQREFGDAKARDQPKRLNSTRPKRQRARPTVDPFSGSRPRRRCQTVGRPRRAVEYLCLDLQAALIAGETARCRRTA